MSAHFVIPGLQGAQPQKFGEGGFLGAGFYDGVTITEYAIEETKDGAKNPGTNLVITFKTEDGRTTRKWISRPHAMNPTAEARLKAQVYRHLRAMGYTDEQLQALAGNNYDFAAFWASSPAAKGQIRMALQITEQPPDKEGKVRTDVWELTPEEANGARQGAFDITKGWTQTVPGAGSAAPTMPAGGNPLGGGGAPQAGNPFAGTQQGTQPGGMPAPANPFGGVAGAPQAANPFAGQGGGQAANPFATQAGGFQQPNGAAGMPAALAGAMGGR